MAKSLAERSGSPMIGKQLIRACDNLHIVILCLRDNIKLVISAPLDYIYLVV
jgi:hypothetical protein